MIHCRKKFPAYLTYCGISVEKLKPQKGTVTYSDPAEYLAAALGVDQKCKSCVTSIRSRQNPAAAGAAMDAQHAGNLARFLARGQAAQKAVDQIIQKGGQ